VELDDRRADVLAGQGECLVALGADLVIPPRVVERVRQSGGQTRPGQQRLDEGPAAADRGGQARRPG
jgi:hypothetical protein